MKTNLTVEGLAKAIKRPPERWTGDCHGISLLIVRSGLVGSDARVARGFCQGVGSQHSWIALSGDCYDEEAPIMDPTLWTYDEKVSGLWWGTLEDGRHIPHGQGSIWEYGRPDYPEGNLISLTPSVPLSSDARSFLDMLGPLDRKGWSVLAHAPVKGWPSAEILAAMDDTDELSSLIPIDIIGMITDRNPKGLYR